MDERNFNHGEFGDICNDGMKPEKVGKLYIIFKRAIARHTGLILSAFVRKSQFSSKWSWNKENIFEMIF